MPTAKKSPKNQPPTACPTPERILKSDGDYDLGASPARIYTFRDSQIERLHRRKIINAKQLQALKRFYKLAYIAGRAGSVRAVDLNRVSNVDKATYSHLPSTERQAHALTSWRAAVAAIGTENADLVRKICIDEHSITDTARSLCLGRTDTAARLRAAADRLIELWGW